MSRRLRAWRWAWIVHVENVRSSRSWSLVATLLACLEPAVDRRVLAVDDLALGEEIAGKRRPRRPFDHLLEPAARDHFGVDVDAVFDQDAEDPLVIAVARQAAG